MNEIPRMNDVHMHIVPGVDDGSWDMDMSILLLKMAWLEGVEKIIATPHSSAFSSKKHFVREAFEELKQEAKRQHIPIELYLGCEIKCREEQMDSILEDIQTKKFPTLNETNYVLIEFDKLIEPNEVIICVKRLLENGWIPILAHVERYSELFMDFSVMEQLQELGCLFQVNVYMYNKYEEDDTGRKEHAYKMLEKQMVSFLGTDCHRTFHRPPSVQVELEHLYETYDNAYLDTIVFQNAERLLKL